MLYKVGKWTVSMQRLCSMQREILPKTIFYMSMKSHYIKGNEINHLQKPDKILTGASC